MRRFFLYFAIVPGLFVFLSLPSLAAVSHAAKAHSSARAARVQYPRASAHHAARRVAERASVRRARKRSTHLKPLEPAAHALIDPVPRGRFPFPAPLRGSYESLVRQNVRSEKDGLARIEDEADLLRLRQAGQLVGVPVNAALRIDERLPANRRYCRGWTAHFLSDLSRVHYARFHRALQVNSAVRTVAYQRRLGEVNGNAAPAEGDVASPHLTGATIDIAKKGLSMSEIGWMRAYLMPLQTAGKIDVEEEFYQSCFHITVYRSYVPEDARPERRRNGSATLLASKMR